MKIIPNSRRHHYLSRVGIFLIMVALIAGMIGCEPTPTGSPTPTPQYDLTITSTAGGSVTTPGEGTFTYDEGTVLSLVATPDAGYRFVDWTGDVVTIANVNAASTTITMNGNYSISANFEVIPPVQYNLTISSTAGGLVKVPGEGTFAYDAGTAVSVGATPTSGYRFVNWTGDVGIIGNVNYRSTTITMNSDYSITANFEEVPEYDLTISSTAGGSVTSPGEGTFNYYKGAVVSLTATPASGYQFVNWTGDVGTIANVNAASTTIRVNRHYSITANFGVTPMVAAGLGHTLGLKDDGTVVAVGGNASGQCDVGAWTDIVQVAAGYWHTVGVESGGTVVAVGDNGDGQCNVGGWTDIVQVTGTHDHTVGVESDGTVVAVGDNSAGQCNVGGWTDITQVAASYYHTVGLESDGTVVAVGWNAHGQCNVSGWTDITQVAADGSYTVGLKDDGTVVAAGVAGGDVSGWDLD